MPKYINKRIGTDVQSWLVMDIDEDIGSAVAIEVEKKIKPVMIPGGFAGHCPNLQEEFRNAEPVIKEGAHPICIYRKKNGTWYFRCPNVICAIKSSSVKNVDEVLQDNPSARLVGDDIVWFDFTKTGKLSHKIVTLGKLEDECRYFYDYNF